MGKTIATNKKAYRDYFFTETWECGIVLKGTEVKSMRAGEISFTDSFAHVEGNEIILYNLHISPYQQGGIFNEDPVRPRKLLVHKKEIKKISGSTAQKGLTLIPAKIYFNDRGFVKVELALGRGKKLYDKRETIKKRDIERGLKRAVRQKRK